MQAPTSRRLAALLAYPDAEFFSTLARCRAGGSSADAVERFAREIDGLSLRRLQELYVNTFDLDPACTLDMGWHLFGESYERGAFLSALRADLDQHGIPEERELPDHLSSVLSLADRLDAARAEQLRRTIRPALVKLHAALADRANPYAHLVQGVLAATDSGD